MQSFTERYGNADVPHRKKYGRAVNEIGLEKLKRILPGDTNRLVAAYNVDKNFNTIKINEWDRAAGYSEIPRTGEFKSFSSPLKNWLYDLGVNSFSCSELVCVLKEAATQVVEKAIA